MMAGFLTLDRVGFVVLVFLGGGFPLTKLHWLEAQEETEDLSSLLQEKNVYLIDGKFLGSRNRADN